MHHSPNPLPSSKKGDQQAWIELGRKFPRIRVVESDELEKRPDPSGTNHIMYVVGESEPFTGMGVWYNKDGSKSRESVFQNGKLHGTEMRYTKDGSAIKIPMWTAKSMVYLDICTMRQETRTEETPYVDGKRHGTEAETLIPM